MSNITLRVNGKSHTVDVDPTTPLLYVLRNDLGMQGPRFGCGLGQCGACAVLIKGEAVRSCVRQVSAVQGAEITTLEGLAVNGKLHPVQQAFLDAEAFQCGYCTPGMVIATIGLLRTTPNPSEADIARLMDRNVCRCGAYSRIVQAIKSAAAQMSTPGRGSDHE